MLNFQQNGGFLVSRLDLHLMKDYEAITTTPHHITSKFTTSNSRVIQNWVRLVIATNIKASNKHPVAMIINLNSIEG